jgi:hypothetical protein
MAQLPSATIWVDEMANYVSPGDGEACATWRGKPTMGGPTRVHYGPALDEDGPPLNADALVERVRSDMERLIAEAFHPSRSFAASPMARIVAAPKRIAPRPGQRWRSPTGEEGRIYDLTHEEHASVWHLRMGSGLRVREEHDDLVTAWTYVDGPTEPETAREAKDRVGALMVADRPDGVTERTWQAVVAAMGEGEDDAGMRQKCAAARVALVVAERMRVVR